MEARRWERVGGLPVRRDSRDLSSKALIFSLRLELLSIVPCEGTKSGHKIVYKKPDVRSLI